MLAYIALLKKFLDTSLKKATLRLLLSQAVLAEEAKLQGVKYKDVFWRSIDSHKDIEEASKEMKEAKLS